MNEVNNKYSEAQEAWLHDLETTEELQGKNSLCSIDENGKLNFCCLGRLMEVCKVPKFLENPQDKTYTYILGNNQSKCYPVEQVANKVNFRDHFGNFKKDIRVTSFHGKQILCDDLTCFNDNVDWTFKQIAAWIRENPWQVFTNFARPESKSNDNVLSNLQE